MASNKFFILAFFVVFNVLSSSNLSLAARNLLQTTTPSIPTVPVVPTLPKPTPLPPLPTLPLPTTIPSLPNLPTIPSIPQFNFPQIPNIPSLPTIPTTIPSIPFFSPPPSATIPLCPSIRFADLLANEKIACARIGHVISGVDVDLVEESMQMIGSLQLVSRMAMADSTRRSRIRNLELENRQQES
ncbi:uncharacterized protein LOC112004833 [Quercus suber]|uniref:uncharacterized protein LOC112004833 n=1 Tax=Quercus suber TaxID=58331 RepID=UPI0032DF62A9